MTLHFESAFSVMQLKHRFFLRSFGAEMEALTALLIMENLYEIQVVNLGREFFYIRSEVFLRVMLTVTLRLDFQFSSFLILTFELSNSSFPLLIFELLNPLERFRREALLQHVIGVSRRASAIASFFPMLAQEEPPSQVGLTSSTHLTGDSLPRTLDLI